MGVVSEGNKSSIEIKGTAETYSLTVVSRSSVAEDFTIAPSRTRVLTGAIVEWGHQSNARKLLVLWTLRIVRKRNHQNLLDPTQRGPILQHVAKEGLPSRRCFTVLLQVLWGVLPSRCLLLDLSLSPHLRLCKARRSSVL